MKKIKRHFSFNNFFPVGIENINFCTIMFTETSVTRLGDLAPIGRQIKLTGSFFNFRRAQLIGLQIGRFLKIPIFVAFHVQIHVNWSKLVLIKNNISKILLNNFKNSKNLQNESKFYFYESSDLFKSVVFSPL